MTKLWIVSDLHMDYGDRMPPPPPEADIAVLAGDICDDVYLGRLTLQMPVIFVAGNHEYYVRRFQERMDELRGKAWWFLDNSEVTILGVRFVGATLWTDYAGGNTEAMRVAAISMADHRMIYFDRESHWFEPRDALQMHRESVEYLRSRLADNSPSTTPTVVVTHHAPSTRSVHTRFERSGWFNHAFVSNLDYLVEGSDAALWVHGHVHNNFDYQIGKTRVLCNPRGYPGENPEFDHGLIVEVGNG